MATAANSSSSAGNPAGVLSLGFSPRGDALLSTARDGSGAALESVETKPRRGLFRSFGAGVGRGIFARCVADRHCRRRRHGANLARRRESAAADLSRPRWAGLCRGLSPQGNWIASAAATATFTSGKPTKTFAFLTTRLPAIWSGSAAAKRCPRLAAAFHTPDYRLQGHTAEIRDLVFSTDGRVVLSGSNDNTVRRWSLRAMPKARSSLPSFAGRWMGSRLRAWRRARYAASGSLDGQIKLWDADEYEEVRSLRGHEDAVYWAAFSRDGHRIVTAGRDRRASCGARTAANRCWSSTKGTRCRSQSAGGLTARLKEGHDFLVTSAAFLPG